MGCRIYVLRAAGTDLGIHYGLGAAFKNVTGLLQVRVLVQVDGKIRLQRNDEQGPSCVRTLRRH